MRILSKTALADSAATRAKIHAIVGGPEPISLHCSDLTARERQIVMMVAASMPNKQIAYALGISIETVKVHVSHVMKKLRCRNRVGLALFWISEQMINASETEAGAAEVIQ